MLEKQCTIWAGTLPFNDDKSFLDYIEEKYDSGGDCIPSEFLKSFDIDRIDRDDLEWDYTINPLPFEDFLDGFSYFETFKENAIKNAEKQQIKNVNLIVIAYEYKYSGKIKCNKGVHLVGVFKYLESQ